MSTQPWPPTSYDVPGIRGAIVDVMDLAETVRTVFPPDSIYIRVADQTIRSGEADLERLDSMVAGDPWMADEVLADLTRRYAVET